MREKRNASKLMIGNSERRRWADNIKMDLRGIGWGVVDSIRLSQDENKWKALVDAVMNFRVP
jgi:hypothetical protein